MADLQRAVGIEIMGDYEKKILLYKQLTMCTPLNAEQHEYFAKCQSMWLL